MRRASSRAWKRRLPNAMPFIRGLPTAPSSVTTSGLSANRARSLAMRSDASAAWRRGRRWAPRTSRCSPSRRSRRARRRAGRPSGGAPSPTGRRRPGGRGRPRAAAARFARRRPADPGGPGPGASLVSVHARIDACVQLCSAARSARSRAAAIFRSVVARQRPAGSHGPISCQTKMPASSRRSSMLCASGICERVAFAPIARSPSTSSSSSSAVSASPWPRASAGSAAPRRTQRIAVDVEAAASPT